MTKPLKILLVDDDVQNLALLEEYLSSRFKVVTTSDPTQGAPKAALEKPDLIVLDVNMPKMTGFEVFEEIRTNIHTKETPVIFLTAETQMESVQRGLKLGADDYLVKPFRSKDLIRRIEMRLKRSSTDAPTQCGNLSLDPAALCAKLQMKRKEHEIFLTQKNFLLLQTFLRNEGRVLTREQLLNSAWGSADVSDRAVDLQVFRLRKALQGWNRKILALYGRGYILKA